MRDSISAALVSNRACDTCAHVNRIERLCAKALSNLYTFGISCGRQQFGPGNHPARRNNLKSAGRIRFKAFELNRLRKLRFQLKRVILIVFGQAAAAIPSFGAPNALLLASGQRNDETKGNENER